MISLYLKKLAARRAYTAASNRDLVAWQAWCAGERERVLCDGKRVDYVDVTQAAVTAAWSKFNRASDAWYNALEAL